MSSIGKKSHEKKSNMAAKYANMHYASHRPIYMPHSNQHLQQCFYQPPIDTRPTIQQVIDKCQQSDANHYTDNVRLNKLEPLEDEGGRQIQEVPRPIPKNNLLVGQILASNQQTVFQSPKPPTAQLGNNYNILKDFSCPKYSRFIEASPVAAKGAKECLGSAQTVTSINVPQDFSKLTGEVIALSCASSKLTATSFKKYLSSLDEDQLFEVGQKIADYIGILIDGTLGIDTAIYLSSLDMMFMTQLGAFCKVRISYLIYQAENCDLICHLISKNPFFRTFMVNYVKNRFHLFGNGQIDKRILATCIKISSKYSQFTIHRHLCSWLQDNFEISSQISCVEHLKLLAEYCSDKMIPELGNIFIRNMKMIAALNCPASTSVLLHLLSRNEEHTIKAFIHTINKDIKTVLASKHFVYLLRELTKANSLSEPVQKVKKSLLGCLPDQIRGIETNKVIFERYITSVASCVNSLDDMIVLKSKCQLMDYCPRKLKYLIDSSTLHAHQIDIELSIC